MVLPDPRLTYSATFFKHGDLLSELRYLRRLHSSPANQLVHIVTTSMALAFVASSMVILGKLFTLPDSLLVLLLVLFLPMPYLAFFFYLDAAVFLFWLPLVLLAVAASFPIAHMLDQVLPLYSALGATSASALLCLLPQLLAHFLLEKIRFPALDLFELLLMTPFFLGYCGLGWISCGSVRRGLWEKILSDGP